MKIEVNPDNPYTQMQQREYDTKAAMFNGVDTKTDYVVGTWDWQNQNRAYECLWIEIPDLKDKDVLDFGCGPGRNLVLYHDRFKSIDGVDISDVNLQKAREWITNNGLDVNKFKLYKNDGVSLNGIPDESYDVVMSTICFQHIAVHDIRYNLLREFYRVLRPGGYITIQALYTAHSTDSFVKYYDNAYGTTATNGSCDCAIQNSDYLKAELKEIGFKKFSYYLHPLPLSLQPDDPNERMWIFFNAQRPS